MASKKGYELGDLVTSSRLKWLSRVTVTHYGWEDHNRYEVKVEICPDCGKRFLQAWRMRTSTYWSRKPRCNKCQPIHDRKVNRNKMRRYRARNKEDMTRDCQHCGQSFTPQRSTAKFCSAACRAAAHRAAA